MQIGPVILAVKSDNSKLGRCATTYLPINKTCPDSCRLKKTGECYARGGRTSMYVQRLDRLAASMTSTEIAVAEATAIDSPPNSRIRRRPLRLHTSGDCRTKTAARIVGQAATRYQARGGGPVWTYTHSWKVIDPWDWQEGVSVLASLDDVKDTAEALSRGYAPARYVAAFRNKSAWQEEGVRWMPCPAQLREGMTCSACRLCFNARALHARNTGIAFAAHGNYRKRLRQRLLKEEPRSRGV